MWTGTSALKDIDKTLHTIRNEAVRLDAQLSQITNSLASKERHRLKIINDIAAVRLVEIESGELQQGLNSADIEAAKILKKREVALQSLNETIEQLDREIVSAEERRESLLLEVNATSQKLVDLEAEVQASLKADQQYLDQLELARAKESVAEEANSKAEQAEVDLKEKAKPYQQDELFIYLWERGYGTTDYQGGLFARFMDGWVARLIKFEPARINYWNLTEIPKRLNEHADRVSTSADESLMELQQLELDALEAGGVKALELDLENLRERLDTHDDSLEGQETNLNTKLGDRARFMAGEDSYIQQCLEKLSSALNHQSLQAVHRYVMATNSPTDDQLVIEMRSVDDAIEGLNSDLRDVRVMHERKISKLKELESVRRNFKNSRYDDVRSGFGNKSIITGMLGQFLQGLISSADLWQTIQRNQRYRDVGSLPDFGSGGVGNIGDIFGNPSGSHKRRKRRQRRSTWHLPSPRRGGGGFNLPRGGGRRSSGGFKTGGGF